MRYITHEEAQRSLDVLVELIYGPESGADTQSAPTEDSEPQPQASELLRLLELDGYECRLSDGHVEILGRSGRELVRIPIEAFAEDDYRAALPVDLLNRD